MELKKLSEHIWFMPYESERDRPNLGYVKGDNWSLAIDAGHSDNHVKEFYSLLEAEGLPLPSLTVPFTNDESLARNSAILAYSIFSPVRLSTTRPRTPPCAQRGLKNEKWKTRNRITRE